MTVGLKTNAITDAEFQHLRMSTKLKNEFKPGNDSIVKVNQFVFGQIVYVDFHGSSVIGWRVSDMISRHAAL